MFNITRYTTSHSPRSGSYQGISIPGDKRVRSQSLPPPSRCKYSVSRKASCITKIATIHRQSVLLSQDSQASVLSNPINELQLVQHDFPCTPNLKNSNSFEGFSPCNPTMIRHKLNVIRQGISAAPLKHTTTTEGPLRSTSKGSCNMVGRRAHFCSSLKRKHPSRVLRTHSQVLNEACSLSHIHFLQKVLRNKLGGKLAGKISRQHRKSTIIQYQGCWSAFQSWLVQNQVKKLTEVVILKFLDHLVSNRTYQLRQP